MAQRSERGCATRTDANLCDHSRLRVRILERPRPALATRIAECTPAPHSAVWISSSILCLRLFGSKQLNFFVRRVRSKLDSRAGAAGEPSAGRARALEDDPPGGARALRRGQRHDRPRVRALPDAQAELRLPPIRATGMPTRLRGDELRCSTSTLRRSISTRLTALHAVSFVQH